jgi:hypothetical protein
VPSEMSKFAPSRRKTPRNSVKVLPLRFPGQGIREFSGVPKIRNGSIVARTGNTFLANSDSTTHPNFPGDSPKGFLDLSPTRQSGGATMVKPPLAEDVYPVLKNRTERLETPLPWSLGDSWRSRR